MKKLMLALGLCTLSTIAAAGIEGTYHCEGTDPNGPKYEGTVIVSKSGEVYKFDMQYNTGEKSIGLGIYEPNRIDVAFHDPVKNITGLQIYTFSDKNDKLAGKWLHLDSNKIGYEECIKK